MTSFYATRKPTVLRDSSELTTASRVDAAIFRIRSLSAASGRENCSKELADLGVCARYFWKTINEPEVVGALKEYTDAEAACLDHRITLRKVTAMLSVFASISNTRSAWHQRRKQGIRL